MFDRSAKSAFIAVVLVLTAGSVGFRSAVRRLNVYLNKEPVDLRSQLDNISTHLGRWEMVGKAPKLSAELVEELGTQRYLFRQYRFEGERDPVAFQLHLAYYTGMIDAVPHVPDRCFVAAGYNARTRPRNIPFSVPRDRWETHAPDGPSGQPYHTVTYADPFTREPVTVRMPEGAFKLRTTEFSVTDDADARIFAGYFFIANGRTAVTPEDVKRIAFHKSEKYAYYCKVQLSAFGGHELTAEEFVARSADLVDALLPELMRCLPDWGAVQARAAEGAEIRSLGS